VLCAAAELGVSVPGQLSVTGYDDIPPARFSVPPLTTVAQPLDAMAREAIDRLLLRVSRPAEAPEPVLRVHSVELVVRASTAAPYGGSALRPHCERRPRSYA
jgi:LacI family xylobiose transport system transcriptional regulator